MTKRTLSLGIILAAIVSTLSACGGAGSVAPPTPVGHTEHNQCQVPQQPGCYP